MSKKYLVTEASGFVRYCLVRELIRVWRNL